MDDGLRVGFRREDMTLGGQFFAQLAEILDDAVMHDGHAVARVRMGVVLRRAPMRRPARMADADMPFERMRREPFFEIAQLAARANARQPSLLQRRDARRNHSRDIRAAVALQ